MVAWPARAGVWLLGLAATAALASPTSNEYARCHRLAAATLEHCLNAQPGAHASDACWTQSRQRQQVCYRELRESHSRPAPRPPTAPQR